MAVLIIENKPRPMQIYVIKSTCNVYYTVGYIDITLPEKLTCFYLRNMMMLKYNLKNQLCLQSNILSLNHFHNIQQQKSCDS